jgi:aromatic-L-amino-acid/L-tryptophan decarboxylase
MPDNSEIEEFRRAAHQTVDWIADYLADPRQYPVLPRMQPGDLIDRLPGAAPEEGEPFETLLSDFRNLIVPATTHWNHPRFMAYFGSSGSAPGVLGEMLAAALNNNAMVWKAGPASTELERVTLDWLRQWLGLPREFFGLIFDSASMSTFHAIAAAREMADPESRARGMRQPLTVYASEQAHSSVEKGTIALGIGQDNMRKIPVDAEFRLRPDALVEAIEQDLRAGKKPCCVVATVGTTSTTSVDPVAAVADIAERYGMWFHIDGAYGGAAAILPEHRSILNGAERADSMLMNPHKWLFTPSDVSAFFTRRPEVLRRAFTLVPEYLRTNEDGRVVNLMDYGVQLGRRFRSLKLWFVMRHYGRTGIQKILRSHIAWAQELAQAIRADARFEVVAPIPMSVVCFRVCGSDDRNRRLLDRVNASGKTFLSHTSLHGRFVIRMAIGNIGTTRDDVQEIWRLVSEAVASEPE